MTRKAGFKVPSAVERRGILRGYEEAVAAVYDLLLSRGNDKDDCLALCRYVMALRDTVYGTGDGEPIGMLNAVANGAGAKETP